MPISDLYFVNIGPHGTFESSGDVHTQSKHIDAIFDHIRQQKIHKLALHFHGGLVPESRGMAKAEAMLAVYQKADCHPVTFVWETGFIETLQANLDRINQTELFRKVLFWTLKKAGKHLGVGVDAKGVGSEFSDATIEAELKGDAPFESLRVGDGARGGTGPLTGVNLKIKEQQIASELQAEMTVDGDFRALLAAPEDQWSAVAASKLEPAPAHAGKGVITLAHAFWAVAKIATRVLRRTVERRDHGFYPTVVEEILRALYLDDFGAWVWGGMKNAAEAMWWPNDGRSGDARHAGRYFLEGLGALQQEAPGLTVDLIGHSAGSIAICHLLKTAAATTGLKVRHVLLLAPAARVELFHDEIVSKPERFKSLRIFTMDDERECKDHLVKGFYTRSLLYFISGVLEGGNDVPLVGLARHLLNNDVYRDGSLPEIRKLLGAPPGQWLTLSPSPKDAPHGWGCGAESHGGFDEEGLTTTSLTHILSQP